MNKGIWQVVYGQKNKIFGAFNFNSNSSVRRVMSIEIPIK